MMRSTIKWIRNTFHKWAKSNDELKFRSQIWLKSVRFGADGEDQTQNKTIKCLCGQILPVKIGLDVEFMSMCYIHCSVFTSLSGALTMTTKYRSDEFCFVMLERTE